MAPTRPWEVRVHVDTTNSNGPEHAFTERPLAPLRLIIPTHETTVPGVLSCGPNMTMGFMHWVRDLELDSGPNRRKRAQACKLWTLQFAQFPRQRVSSARVGGHASDERVRQNDRLRSIFDHTLALVH